MNEENQGNYKVDFSAIIDELKNQTINKLFIANAQTEEEAKRYYKLFRAFNKRGVSSEIVIEALMESLKEE